MKKIFLILSVIAVILVSCSESDNPSIPEPQKNEITKDRLLYMINFVRTNPKEYAKILEKRLSRFEGKIYTDENGQQWSTQEGAAVVQEAINDLKTVYKSVQAVSYNDKLAEAAKYHVDDIGPKGMAQHNSSNGESSGNRIKRYYQWKSYGEVISFGSKNSDEVVAQLIIDDGVSNRGHRKVIMTDYFKEIGFAWGFHSVYGIMCTIDFASKQ